MFATTTTMLDIASKVVRWSFIIPLLLFGHDIVSLDCSDVKCCCYFAEDENVGCRSRGSLDGDGPGLAVTGVKWFGETHSPFCFGSSLTSDLSTAADTEEGVQSMENRRGSLPKSLRIFFGFC